MKFRQQLRSAKTIVVKIGTRVLIDEGPEAATDIFAALAASIANLRASGRRVLLVSSGAVGIGARHLQISSSQVSVCAAAGQSLLAARYHRAFGGLGISTAQILVTDEDFSRVHRHRRLRETLVHLLDLGVVPIINENDVVTHSLDSHSDTRVFSDNDMLSSLIARTVDADLLVLLTDVDGVFSEHPTGAHAALIPEIREHMTFPMEFEQTCELGRGGIHAKLKAALHAVQKNRLFAVIANGHTPEVLERIVNGHQIGTLVISAEAQ